MSKHWEGFIKPCFEIFQDRTGDKYDDCYGTFKRNSLNSNYSKSDNL